MTNYVIVGAGAAGLYTAYRLLSGGTLNQGDTVRLYEWSNRPGGRIYSYTFPQSAFPPGTTLNGLYCEFGGMRFATDKDNFPKNPAKITEGHVLVQQTIIALGLQGKAVQFLQSSNRLYYLRGSHVYENNLTTLQELEDLPYKFNSKFKAFAANIPVPPPPPPLSYTADTILGEIARQFAPKLGGHNSDRANWCTYYATGKVLRGNATPSFPAGTLVSNMGYWNLLYDQLGDEGFDYSADGAGYTSNVINWNSADAMQANNDYGSNISYMRLDGGYSLLFEKLATEITRLAANYPGSGIVYNERLTSLAESQTDNTTTCTFIRHAGRETSTSTAHADVLFLAMPRRALEMVAHGSPPEYMLNNPQVKYCLQSSIDQPAIKAVLVFDQAWWTSAPYPPQLLSPDPNNPLPAMQQVGGATITDLPLRMIYYFANNVPGGPGASGGPYVLLASYDDMNYSDFWRQLEVSEGEPPQSLQELTGGPTSVSPTSAFAGLLLKQLAEVHGIADVATIPAPTAVYFQDWGQNPFGAGYHGWAPHYNICEMMDCVRAPYQKILQPSQGYQTYIIGSCYSFDQAWVEGAFCTAESVLQEFIQLGPLNSNIGSYTLVCKP
jgi:hypothetical protein